MEKEIDVPTLKQVLNDNPDISGHRNSPFLFHFKGEKTSFTFGGIEWELRMFSFYLTKQEMGSIAFGDFVNRHQDGNKALTKLVLPCGMPIYFWAINDETGYINLSIRPIS